MASQEELDREQELLRLTQQRAGIQEDILEDVRDIGNVISDQLKNLKFERQERAEIRSLVREVNKTASENYNTTLKDLGSQKQLAKLAKDRKNLTDQLLSLNNLQQKFAQGTTEEEKNMSFALKEQIIFTQNLVNNLAEIESQSKAIANSFSVKNFEGLSRIVKDIPILRQFAAPFEQAANASRLTVAQNAKLKEQFGDAAKSQSAFLAGTKELGIAFSNLAGAALFASIISSFGKLNKVQTDIRRNLGETTTALDLVDSKFGTVADQLETINSLTNQFGFNTLAAFDAINLREATELTKALGLSAEEAGMLAFNAQVSGENLKDGYVQAYNAISPLLSQRKILQEISKLSPSITLAFKNSNEELAEAASNAKLLGLNLSQVDKIANGLLDIEQSIASEFEAEVITGKQLNLERARFFALTNDIDGLTKEIANNQEVINSFATGTRIEQEAIAGALGLGRDELAKMVQEQSVLSKMSAAEIKEKEAADNKRLEVQQSLNDSIAKMAEAFAGPLEAIAALVSNSFILYATLGSITTLIGTRLITSLGAAIVQMGIFSSQSQVALFRQIGLAAAWAALNPITALAGLAAAGAVTYGLYSLTKPDRAGDIMSPSKGKTLISPREGGLFELSPNDDYAAAPGLLDKLKGGGIDKKIPTPTPQESKPIEIRGLDKLLSVFSVQESKQLELNQASSPIQPLGREIESSLPTSTPLPERGIGRNTPTATSVAIDYDKLADAIAMGAERGTSKANLNVNLDGNRVSNALQTPQAMNTRKYGI